jgi:hypothetical protein
MTVWMVRFSAVKNSVIIISLPPITCRVLGMISAGNPAKSWKTNRNIETRSRLPLQFHQNGLLWVPGKFATSILIPQHEQCFDGLGEWDTQHSKNCFILDSLWRMSLIVRTVVRKLLAIVGVLANGYFVEMSQGAAPKSRVVARGKKDPWRINHHFWISRVWFGIVREHRHRASWLILHESFLSRNLSPRNAWQRIFILPSPFPVDSIDFMNFSTWEWLRFFYHYVYGDWLS